MGIKISALPASAGAATAMQFEVNNAGVSERLTLAQMFALSMAAVTVDTPLLNMAQTWNAGAVTFTGWKLNVTDTASAAASKLLDLQVGGSPRFSVTKAGSLRLGDPTCYDTAGSQYCRFGASRFTAPVEFALSASAATSSPDLFLKREAAHILGLSNGTNAQEFRLYNTFTDASNYERGFLRWNANVFEIGTAYLGTGTNRELNLVCGANIRLYSTGGASVIVRNSGNTVNLLEVSAVAVNVSRHLLFPTDNTYDIGASGATRPRNLFLAGGLTHGGTVLLTTTTALANGAADQTAGLNNSPIAGDPTKWIPINDNGTTRYIPAW